MIKLVIITVASVFCLESHAQETELGILFGGNLYQHIAWNRPVYNPPNAYHTYIEKEINEGLLNKSSFVNGVHFGLIARYKYKRFTLNIEPQFYYQRTYFDFEKPFVVERIIGKRAFRMPIYLAYKVFKNPKSPFLLAGLSLNKEKNFDFTSPGFDYYYGNAESYNLKFDTGDDHFLGALYTNSWYFNYVAGFGFTFDKWQYAFRFQQRLEITKNKIEAKIFQVEMTFNIRIFSSTDFTKKHFLYVE